MLISSLTYWTLWYQVCGPLLSFPVMNIRVCSDRVKNMLGCYLGNQFHRWVSQRHEFGKMDVSHARSCWESRYARLASAHKVLSRRESQLPNSVKGYIDLTYITDLH